METFETRKEALLAYHQDEQQQEERDKDDLLNLPPGFRFHPTDEEIILHYLIHKVSNHDFVARAIGEVDLNKVEPWDLPKKAKMGEKEWWFFCQRDRKYPTGMRTNRATETGYWKATGKDKEIFKGKSNFLVGMKKTLVFYRGRAPKGEKSNWVMHEFRLEGQFSYNKSTRDAEWVVCRVFHKSTGVVRGITMENDENNQMDSFVDNLIHSPSTLTLPALTELSPNYASKSPTNFLYDHQQQQQQHDFKPIPLTAPSSSHGNNNNSPYFPFTYMLHPHSVGSANPPVGYPHTAGFNGYAVNVDSAVIAKQLMKVEPSSYNNNVSGSQETGLSMEVATNTETTSALSKSKQIVGDDQSSPRPFDDLDGDPSYHDGDMDDDLVDPYAFWDHYGTDNP